jgi:hypothetical protein
VTIRDLLVEAIIDQLFQQHGTDSYECAYWNLTRSGIAITADAILALPGIAVIELPEADSDAHKLIAAGRQQAARDIELEAAAYENQFGKTGPDGHAAAILTEAAQIARNGPTADATESVNAGTSIDSHTLLIVNHPTVIDRGTGGGYGGQTIYDYQARDDDNGKRRYQPASDGESYTRHSCTYCGVEVFTKEQRQRRLHQLADDFALNARDAHNRGNYDAGSAWTTAAAELYAALGGKPGATVTRSNENEEQPK